MGVTPLAGRFKSWRRSERAMLLAAVAVGLLTSCVATPPLYESEAQLPPESEAPPEAGATYTPQPSLDGSAAATDPEPSPAAAQFNFPQASCGDQASEPSGVWYAVFLDGTTVEEVRSRYCGDAISTTRSDSGTPTVQVASFTSYARALSLAQLVGGTVEQAAAPNVASPPPSSDYQSADRAAPPTSPNPEPAVPAGSAAALTAQDPTTPINIRTSASTAAPIQTTGYAGDAVQISQTAQGDDGYTWYEIQLESGVVGWVRGDLVTDAAAAPPPAQPAYPEAPPSYPATPPPAASAPRPYPAAPPPDRPYSPPYPPAAAPPSATRLTARDPGSSINVREGASLNARIRYIGYPGDPVRIASSARGDDGYTWYQVQFETGTMGWVRSDFVGSY